ncbi:isochorismatase family protein [Candidatus Methylopumilus planktonicus]|uniref:isochorismatase family protein n=1 Tax=Candidatus Methylopumilus planktonicus TaxID=1581557 RepID=UPI0011232603|nr:isochorismatase family protein [Candidatus Methylopumilus planktonicus]QDD02209.1 isochorismatase family protein [Candidatus Methylopumilus planktonicus]
MINDQLLSQVVVIDIQDKLVDVMPKSEIKKVIDASSVLIQAAKILEVPCLYTEQYPKGLGLTVKKIKSLLPGPAIEKKVFSCLDESKFKSALVKSRPQIILCGLETHICILQTALALKAAGKEVFVVEDATLSRSGLHHQNAIARLRSEGIVVTNIESVIFEWLRAAEGDHFKIIVKLIKS